MCREEGVVGWWVQRAVRVTGWVQGAGKDGTGEWGLEGGEGSVHAGVLREVPYLHRAWQVYRVRSAYSSWRFGTVAGKPWNHEGIRKGAEAWQPRAWLCLASGQTKNL